MTKNKRSSKYNNETRRWDFLLITKEKNKVITKNDIGASFIGTYTEAEKASSEILSNISNNPRYKDQSLNLIPMGYEVISEPILRQLKEYEGLSIVLGRSLETAAIELLTHQNLNLNQEDFNKQKTETVGRWVITEREKFNKETTIDEDLDTIDSSTKVDYGVR
jgi:hypothetical protein